MSQRATGTFDVKLTPLPSEEKSLSRMSLDKSFQGDLQASSKGEMLASGSPASSGGYVAIEKVAGTLHGRKGTFVLQHNATMARGTPKMNIIVVPDSGTEELTGLDGQFSINIAKGKHSYEFDYTLPEAPQGQ